MIVLHGIWSTARRLCLWAEDSERPPQAPRRGGRPPKNPRPRTHPFVADADAVRDVLAPLGERPAKADVDEVALLLPSTPSGPLPSPELPRDTSHGAGQGRAATPGLYPWYVPALTFEPEAALELLGALDREGSEFSVGASVRHLVAAAGLATELAARGRVLPALATEDGGPVARWRIVLTGADTQRARALARSMPPACRCERVGDEPEGRRCDHVLVEALDALADAAVRAALDTRPLLPRRRGRMPAVTPLPERWVGALAGRDARVDAEPGEVAELQPLLDEWRSAAQGPVAPLRTCFRLVEPGEDDRPWRVEFLLQATDEPSLVVPLDEVWRAGDALTTSVGRLERPQETVLADLGRASRLYPEMERALRTPRPSAVETDADGAYGFLKDAAPLLGEAGFGVLLPSWLQSRRRRLGLRLSTSGAGKDPAAVFSDGLNQDALLDFRWDAALGDETLSRDELAELARLKTPLVRVRGQWTELDPKRLAAALDFLERGGTGQMSAGEALSIGLRPDDVAGELPVVDVRADGWLGDLLSGQAEHRLEPAGTPTGFEGRLRPYQERGLAWLAFLDRVGLGGCLADDMGLGKSPQTLALLVRERQDGARPRPTLLVCPMSVVGNWQREAARFAPTLVVHVHHGSDRLAGDDLVRTAAEADMVITTFALAARDREPLSAVEWGRVVVDEAQNIKNGAAKQTRAVRGLPAPRRIALTGTPMENRLSDLHSIMEFANPGLLGPASRFRERFAVPIERHGDEEAGARLRQMTQPFILRRLKTDRSIITDLPDKLEMKVFCNLTAEQASLYQAVVDDMLARIEGSEGMERRGLVLATMAKLKQVCNHPAHLLRDGSRLPRRSGKVARLEETLEEALAEGEKALCFTQFTEFGEMLRAHLTARFGEVLYLHGGTPKRERDAMVARFQEASGPSLFLLSLKAGGTGLNLTAASHVVHVDRWWNPAVEDQATDRAFRIGQHRNVQVRKFVCVGTLEERIDAMIEEKKALAERIVGAGEDWLTELSTAQLRDVVALSRTEAVSE